MSSKPKAEREGSTNISTPDANNATYFFADEYSGSDRWLADFYPLDKERYLGHLKEINEGRKNGNSWYNDGYLTNEDNWHLIEAFASNLDLTRKQTERADQYFSNFNLGTWGVRKQLVAYALCAYVVKSDERNEVRRTHPNVPDGDRDTLFVEMADSLDITHREFVKTYGKVQHEADKYRTPPKIDRPDGAGPGGGVH